MKVTTTDIDTLREALAPLGTDERRQQYRDGDFVLAESVKDLDKRYRWDLFWAATGPTFESQERWNLTDGLNDSHIDTALRRIVAPLDRAQASGGEGVNSGALPA